MHTVQLAIETYPSCDSRSWWYGRREGGPHNDMIDVKTTVVRPPGGYWYHFALLGGPEFLNDFA